MSWDGRFYSMTIDQQGSPELYHELADLPARARAERLRSLALIGLAALKGGAPISTGSTGVHDEEKKASAENEAGTKRKAAKKALGDKLLKGLL